MVKEHKMCLTGKFLTVIVEMGPFGLEIKTLDNP